MPSTSPRKLLVEGDTDKRVIPYLMEANGVEWGSSGRPVVRIEPYHGVEELLKPGVVEAELRASGLEALGVLVDANGDAADRWNRIKALCDSQFEGLPDRIPQNGLETTHPGTDVRFGVWIMPDNRFSGMLEDFLIRLVPEGSRELYELAGRCVVEASRSCAPFKDVHKAKAEIHTWLAWQDEPGRQLHQAVHHRVLDPERPESQPFVNWFKRLFVVWITRRHEIGGGTQAGASVAGRAHVRRTEAIGGRSEPIRRRDDSGSARRRPRIEPRLSGWSWKRWRRRGSPGPSRC